MPTPVARLLKTSPELQAIIQDDDQFLQYLSDKIQSVNPSYKTFLKVMILETLISTNKNMKYLNSIDLDGATDSEPPPSSPDNDSHNDDEGANDPEPPPLSPDNNSHNDNEEPNDTEPPSLSPNNDSLADLEEANDTEPPPLSQDYYTIAYIDEANDSEAYSLSPGIYSIADIEETNHCEPPPSSPEFLADSEDSDNEPSRENKSHIEDSTCDNHKEESYSNNPIKRSRKINSATTDNSPYRETTTFEEDDVQMQEESTMDDGQEANSMNHANYTETSNNVTPSTNNKRSYEDDEISPYMQYMLRKNKYKKVLIDGTKRPDWRFRSRACRLEKIDGKTIFYERVVDPKARWGEIRGKGLTYRRIPLRPFHDMEYEMVWKTMIPTLEHFGKS